VEETSRSLGSGGVRMQSKLARPKNILVDSIRKNLDCARTAVSGIQNNLKEMIICKLILTREHHQPSQSSPAWRVRPSFAMLRNMVGVISEPRKSGKNLVTIQYNVLRHKEFYLPQIPYFITTQHSIKASQVPSTSYHHLVKRRIVVKEENVLKIQTHFS
jgi:hypothetical protein